MNSPYHDLNHCLENALTEMWGRFLVWSLMALNFGIIGGAMLF